VSAQNWLCCCGGGGEPTDPCRCEGNAEFPSSISFQWSGQIVIEQMECTDLDCTPIQQYYIGVKDPVVFALTGSITIPFDEDACIYKYCTVVELDVELWYFAISPAFGCDFWNLYDEEYTLETTKQVNIRPPNISASRDYWEVDIYLAKMHLRFHSEGGYHCLPKMFTLIWARYGDCPATTYRDEYIDIGSVAVEGDCDPMPGGINPTPPFTTFNTLNKIKSAVTGTVTIS
jgi:hypothetical protein